MLNSGNSFSASYKVGAGSPNIKLMIGLRPVLFVVASVGVVAGVTATDWSHVIRETRLEGYVQQEQLVLGRFKRTTEFEDARIKVSDTVDSKLKEYGLKKFGEDGFAAIQVEKRRTEYSFSASGPGDLRQEAKRIAKELPWLTTTWRGALSTSFTAHGYHPANKNYVCISMMKMSERKHGAGMAHTVISIQE